MTKNIFLSYRRDDSQGFTAAIYTLLELHFGSDRIFMDVDTLIPGSDFVQALEDAVGGCDIFLAIIGPIWETVADEGGVRRLDNPEDFVRIEIAHALERGIPVIPVLVGGARMPSSENLPDNLKSLARRHAFSIGDHLRPDVQRLIGVLENTFQELGKEGAEREEPEGEWKDFEVSLADKITKEVQDKVDLPQARAEQANIPKLPALLRKIPVWGWIAGVLLISLIGYAAFGGFTPSSPETPGATETSSEIAALPATATSEPVQESSTSTQTPEGTEAPPLIYTLTTQPNPPTEVFTNTPVPEPLSGAEVVNPQDGSLMIYVPSGEFTMGSDSFEADESPAHIVHLDGYWIYQTEVTNELYRQCFMADACQLGNIPDVFMSNEDFNDYPVVSLTWEQADNYCRWAGVRLPTEAEWEKAGRGETERNYPWGDDPDLDHVNYGGDIEILPVGSYPAGASPYGVLDMSGNVYEYVADWYDPGYYAISPLENPQGPENGTQRVIRGGSWESSEEDLRVTRRFVTAPLDQVGFRCVSSYQP